MNKPDIIIHRKTHATVTIECNHIISRELSQYFSSYATNYRWSPLFKSKQWDGKIYFFKISNNTLPIGLVEKVYQFAKQGNYSIDCTYKRFNDISREDFQRFIDTLNIPFKLRDYQFEAAYQCICKKVLNVLANTRSGKSLMVYIVVRFMIYMKLKTIILVPQKSLVEQMFSDFESYGWTEAKRYCHKVYGGQEKYFDCPVTIACFMSMISTKVKKINPYEVFDCLICDEAHGAKAKSIQDLSNVCINAEYRFGYSGTYPEATIADWYSIVGSLGPIQQFTTYKELQENGHIAKLKIYNIILKYNKDFKLKVYNECGSDFNLQSDMIYNNPDRNKFILKLVQNLQENCLLLFTKKEGHGYGVRDLFMSELKDKHIIYIDGDVSVEEREAARKLMETRNDVVMLATYSLMSTGITISNLHTVGFLSGYKSKTKVLQSLGRSLGLSPNKKYAKLLDFCDDCSFQNRIENIKFINHSMNHFKERLHFYDNESWEYKNKIFEI